MEKLSEKTLLTLADLLNRQDYLEKLHSLEEAGLDSWLKEIYELLLSHQPLQHLSLWQRLPRKKGFGQIFPDESVSKQVSIPAEIIDKSLDASQMFQLTVVDDLQSLGLDFLVDSAQNPLQYVVLLLCTKKPFQHFFLFGLRSTQDFSTIFTQDWLTDLKMSYYTVTEITALRKQCSSLEAQINALESSQMAMHENTVNFMRLHQQLTDSIQYAKKMQQAILPTEPTFDTIFDEHFVIYLPKDIVSGDFYWLAQVDYTFLGVIDCTGHGVPGAFMSMIANTLLSEIVSVKRIDNPGVILSLLHTGVKNALKQEETSNSDGMDVCLIRMERDEDLQLKLLFAGAKRPLYFIRNQQLFKIKGDRENIGGWQRTENAVFKNHKLKLQAGDILYLTTDGFVDAPNIHRRSFGSTRFKEIITENGHLPLNEQKQLLEDALFEHQKDTLQRDDITVVAIKV